MSSAILMRQGAMFVHEMRRNGQFPVECMLFFNATPFRVVCSCKATRRVLCPRVIEQWGLSCSAELELCTAEKIGMSSVGFEAYYDIGRRGYPFAVSMSTITYQSGSGLKVH